MSVQTIVGIMKTVALATWTGFNMFLAFIVYYMFVTQAFIDAFYIIWLLVLPILSISFMIMIPLVWFVVVPGVARRLTMARFRSGALQFIADHTGSADIVQSKLELPEGVVRNKFGWFALPRPTYKLLDEASTKNNEKLLQAERVLLKKCILKDIGKPIWLGCADKMALVNPQTLAALEDKAKTPHNPTLQIQNLRDYTSRLSKEFQKPLKNLVDELEAHLHMEPITYIDPRSIREALPQNYTQTQIDAVAINRENYGRKSAKKDTLMIAVLIVVGMVAVVTVIGILYVLTGGFSG